MPPSNTDPNDLRLVLNPARQRALTVLITSIISHMRFKTSQTFEPSTESSLAQIFDQQDPFGPSTPVGSSDSRRQQRLENRFSQNSSTSTPTPQELKRATLRYFDTWETEVLTSLQEIFSAPADPRSEQRRREYHAERNPPPAYTPTSTSPLLDVSSPPLPSEAEAKFKAETQHLQSLYPPIQTRLTTITQDDRLAIISCTLLLLLSLGHYSAHSRILLCYLTSSLNLPLSVLVTEETELARTLILASTTLSGSAEVQKRKEQNASSRRWKVGLASVAGAAVIGLTGGLAAPVVAGAIGGLMGGVGLGGVASFLGIFAMNGALMGSLFGAVGGMMSAERMEKYAREVEDFKFVPVSASEASDSNPSRLHRQREEIDNRRLRVTIGINGWLDDISDVITPWKALGSDAEIFALRFETAALLKLGSSLKNMVSSYAWSYVKLEILKRTVLATLWSALWPVYLLKIAASIDNPFSVAKNRSEKAGEVLADALVNKTQGERPVTLVGYSLGARVVYSCLNSLAERKAFGLVENVVLIGAPIPSDAENWRVISAVVSGDITNVFSENDYILAFLYRATSIQFGVAGLQNVRGVEGVRNLDLSSVVSGHLRYPALMGKILKRVGWLDVKGEGEIIEVDKEENLDLLGGEVGDLKIDGDARGLSDSGIQELMGEEITFDGAGGRRTIMDQSSHGRAMDGEVDQPPVYEENPRMEQPSRTYEEHRQPERETEDESGSEEGGIIMIDNEGDDEEFDIHPEDRPTRPFVPSRKSLSDSRIALGQQSYREHAPPLPKRPAAQTQAPMPEARKTGESVTK
ncbi:hypothetical protein B7494_g6375 [Chlorociboria aeruginascens]|nr:hypothetical protein B7494_g6375 [Chlorociboria aeruginascens]